MAPCPLPILLHQLIHNLFVAFFACFLFSHFRVPIVSLQYWYFLRLNENISVFISLLHTNISNVIAEWFITITATITSYSTFISIIVTHVIALIQFLLKKRKYLLIKYKWKIFFSRGMQFH